ncbi:MAG: hypothetical protein FWE22_00740 [Firmicutes bacterium]|nr:hypothetical protein [Bacillota bacterium]
MSTIYTGVTGKVTIGGEVAYISNWSVESTREIVEVPELGKKFKQKVAGQANWTASADGTVCFGSDGISGHKNLFDAMNDGTRVKCEFFLLDPAKAKGMAAVKFDGLALIESLSVDLSAEDKGNISISVSGCGSLGFPGKTI